MNAVKMIPLAADHPLLDASVAEGSSDEPPSPPASLAALPDPMPLSPLNDLRGAMQPIMRGLVLDVAFLETIKRNSPRMFLDYLRFAYAADLEGKPGGGNNQQVIIQAPFPRGPLDVLPPHLRIE
jgi:hypothetical protein